MAKFNLSKIAKETGFKNYNKMLEDQTEELSLPPDETVKNINLSLPIKKKDNTVPFEKQLEASRDGKDPLVVTEKNMNESKKLYNNKRSDEWDTNVSPINLVITPSSLITKSGRCNSSASTEAVIVLPVPGGPKKSNFLRGDKLFNFNCSI